MASEIPNPRIVVLRGEQVVAQHELPPDGELMIGRTGQCQVTIPDSTVSRMHARIYADGQAVYLEDLGSANGTFVDGGRVMGTVRLADGQVVRPGQKSLASPVVLRFEDPAKRLLEEMGLIGTREPTPPPAAQPPTPTVPAPPMKAPPPPEPALAAVDSSADSAAAAEEAPPPPPKRKMWPVLAALGLLGVLGVAAFLWWAATMFKPASARWETVQLSSQEVAPGAQVVLQSTEIRPGAELRVLFAEKPVEGAEILPGRLHFDVPELADRPAGSYPVPLSVRDGDLEVFNAMLSYTVRPQVDTVTPLELRVGEMLTITGKSLPDSAGDVQVLIGDHKAQVVEATPARLVARVPLVTRDKAIQLPVAVRAGDWEARPAVTLNVLPKKPTPLDFVVTARFNERQAVWELQSPLGPLFVMSAGPPGADGQPPPAVRDAQERLRELFTAAADDPRLRVETVAEEGRYRLRATSPGGRTWTLVDLSEEDLATTARARRIETTPDLFAFHMAKVWNHLLATLARAEKPPAAGAEGAAYLPVLARLVDSNLAAGGNGRPEEADVAALSVPDRAALSEAFFTVPKGPGSVTGKWTARLAIPDDTSVIEIQMNLTQRGRVLSGTADAALTGTGMTMGLPSSSIGGSVAPGLPPRVKLRMTFPRPVGTLELEGVFENDTLQGAYSSTLMRMPGTWQAVR